jgi:hypothetical protein
MQWIEIIHLKSYTGSEMDRALAAFDQLTAPVQTGGLEKVTLYRGFGLKNELCIIIAWNGALSEGGKSPLGVQLSAAFSEFGHIFHTGWNRPANLEIK